MEEEIEVWILAHRSDQLIVCPHCFAVWQDQLVRPLDLGHRGDLCRQGALLQIS